MSDDTDAEDVDEAEPREATVEEVDYDGGRVEVLTNIDLVPTDEIRPYVNNPKEHPDVQVGKIASSIDEFRWDQPIVVDANLSPGEIVKGHGRHLAAQNLGLSHVPVIWVEYESEAEKRAARLADNRTAESDWDDELLASEIERIIDEDYDASLTGFDEDEIDDLLAEYDGDGPVLDYDPGSLARDFGVPPFSVLDTRKGYWKERRQMWDTMGAGIAPDVGSGDEVFGTHGEDNLAGGILNEFGSSVGRKSGLLGGGNIFDGTWQEDVGKDTAELGGNYDGTSTFDPVLAELLYRWFAPALDAVDDPPTILDPFAGGPARAFVAAVLGKRYVGIDVNPEQVEANRELWDTVVEPLRPDDDAMVRPRWIEGDSADLDDVLEASDVPDVDDVDLVFSCPPYHDLEQYTEDDRDLSNMDYDEFVDAYRTIASKCVDRLADNRFAAFVVSEIRDPSGRYRGFVKETIDAFLDASDDVSFYNDAVLVNQAASLPARVRRQFEGGRKLGRMHQNIVVFWKGDPDPQVVGDALGKIHVPEAVDDAFDVDDAVGDWDVEQEVPSDDD